MKIAINDKPIAIAESRCVCAPIGCGKPVDLQDFKDSISLKEYNISALCQDCQDLFFTEEDEECFYDDREEFELNQLALDNE